MKKIIIIGILVMLMSISMVSAEVTTSHFLPSFDNGVSVGGIVIDNFGGDLLSFDFSNIFFLWGAVDLNDCLGGTPNSEYWSPNNIGDTSCMMNTTGGIYFLEVTNIVGNVDVYLDATTLSSCDENWTQTGILSCDGLISNYTVEYEDQNMCGTTDNLPGDNGTLEVCCVEDWTQSLGACVASSQLITYNDENACGTNYTLPVDNGTTQSCGTSSSSSSSSGTKYLVDADGNIVGVQQNGEVTLNEKPKAPFLSVGGGSQFDLGAWLSDAWKTITGWFA